MASERDSNHPVSEEGPYELGLSNVAPDAPFCLTARDVAQISDGLQSTIRPDEVHFRPIPGGRSYAYVPSDEQIGLANLTFGFCRWACDIKDLRCQHATKDQNGKWTVSYLCTMRVSFVDNGKVISWHEDIGYGVSEGISRPDQAFEQSSKSAVTDARKRCLRLFGPVLGQNMKNKSFQDRASAVKRVTGINNNAHTAGYNPESEEIKQENQANKRPRSTEPPVTHGANKPNNFRSPSPPALNQQPPTSIVAPRAMIPTPVGSDNSGSSSTVPAPIADGGTLPNTVAPVQTPATVPAPAPAVTSSSSVAPTPAPLPLPSALVGAGSSSVVSNPAQVSTPSSSTVTLPPTAPSVGPPGGNIASRAPFHPVVLPRAKQAVSPSANMSSQMVVVPASALTPDPVAVPSSIQPSFVPHTVQPTSSSESVQPAFVVPNPLERTTAGDMNQQAQEPIVPKPSFRDFQKSPRDPLDFYASNVTPLLAPVPAPNAQPLQNPSPFPHSSSNNMIAPPPIVNQGPVVSYNRFPNNSFESPVEGATSSAHVNTRPPISYPIPTPTPAPNSVALSAQHVHGNALVPNMTSPGPPMKGAVIPSARVSSNRVAAHDISLYRTI